MARNPCLAIVAVSMAMAGPSLAAPASPRAVVEAKFAAVNRHDIPGVAAFYAPDATITASDFCKPRQGRAEVERIYKGIFAAIPDAHVNVKEWLVDGDRVAVRFVVESRRPGQSFDFPIMNFFTVKDGLIVRDDGAFDNGGRPCTP